MNPTFRSKRYVITKGENAIISRTLQRSIYTTGEPSSARPVAVANIAPLVPVMR